MSYNYTTTPTGGTTVVNTLLNRPHYTQSLPSSMSTQDWDDFNQYLEEIITLYNREIERPTRTGYNDIQFYLHGINFLLPNLFN